MAIYWIEKMARIKIKAKNEDDALLKANMASDEDWDYEEAHIESID